MTVAATGHTAEFATATAPPPAGIPSGKSRWRAVVDRLLSGTSPQATLRHAVRLIDAGRVGAAPRLLRRAALAGLPDAAYRLGRCYLEAAGVPPSRREGVRWVSRAAEGGHVEAQALLAALCLHGLTRDDTAVLSTDAAASARLFDPEKSLGATPAAQPDFTGAAVWARRAAAAGSADGQALYAYLLTNGPAALRDADAARDWYRRAAAAGSPQGHLGHALALLAGASGDEAEERAAALQHLRVAAAAGLSAAMYLLGALTEQGFAETAPGAPQATAASAVALYRQAAESGHRTAQYRLGLILLDGTHAAAGVPGDETEGESWLRRAALAGESAAAIRLAELYARAGTLPPNYAEAAIWYRRAAELGERRAARALASLHLTGSGVLQDTTEAVRWLRVAHTAAGAAPPATPAETPPSAAPSRVPPSAQGLRPLDFVTLVADAAGGSEGQARTAQWFAEAGAAGDLVAAFNFGLCLARGVGVDRDDIEAARWLRRAAEGVPDAQYAYGRMLAEGRGMPADLAEARHWLGRAAYANLAEAQAALAEMLVNGRGGPRDPQAARDLFERAATAGDGHTGAMFALGALHSGGHGLPVDRAAAQRWWQAAAERGHGYAQLMLARSLAQGAAGPPDPTIARLWLERAAANGVPEAERDITAFTSS